MATEVSGSAGPVVGSALNTMVLPSAEIRGSLTDAIRGIAAMSSVKAHVSEEAVDEPKVLQPAA
jgi:hypothetical protein